jgi:uncharacterized protein YegJ (DUF2314 family)
MRSGPWLCGILLLVCGCSRQPGDRVDRPGQPTVTHVAEDDAKMNAAIKKAGDSIDAFIKALEHPTPQQEMFAIKVGIGDGDTREYMWLSPVEHQNGNFKGVLNNEPIHPQKHKLGDSLTVPKVEAVDWMYADKGVLVGGYTILVLRDTLSPAERAEFDAGLPMKIQ